MGSKVAFNVGSCVEMGSLLGLLVGLLVGLLLGLVGACVVGWAVGEAVGSKTGSAVGSDDGLEVIAKQSPLRQIPPAHFDPSWIALSKSPLVDVNIPVHAPPVPTWHFCLHPLADIPQGMYLVLS